MYERRRALRKLAVRKVQSGLDLLENLEEECDRDVLQSRTKLTRKDNMSDCILS
jgi:hypothetical protein